MFQVRLASDIEQSSTPNLWASEILVLNNTLDQIQGSQDWNDNLAYLSSAADC
jgi:hypothetical protein